MTQHTPQLKCGTCHVELDEGGIGKLIGCEHCDRVFCSADCAVEHDRRVQEQQTQDRLWRQARKDYDRP